MISYHVCNRVSSCDTTCYCLVYGFVYGRGDAVEQFCLERAR